ncbi:class I SAM-dependent methyltransferase [Nonomuraea endophytica]|uniref:O-methyltransferase involved in polyketide biosynthesis n=1 Tax=Nonomuraea endophytica TaxID=714136 RepID=A0A7W8AFE5_9ACTN|nr:class I SAM-dependent methyltransferase [Nonomuraea endophytica]MBB5085155.1 O-methyltransferase involved in polyketide biosynthesis [Nonomuraea endophytica]
MAPVLNPIQESLYLTLYARACDSRLPNSILKDKASGDLVQRLDYDFTRFKASPSVVSGTALRGKKIDDTVRAFCKEHPDGIVLDLGCGLDTRMLRCSPPPSVDWYDVDYAKVIDLRTGLLPGGHPIPADLTTEGWLDEIPSERPAMIVAEGVLPFMPGDTFQRLTRRLTSHLASGALVLNGYTRFAGWSMRFHPAMKTLGISGGEGFDDPREPERWNAGLRLVEEIFLTRVPEVDSFPQPLRAITRLTALSDGLSRQGARILHYRF